MRGVYQSIRQCSHDTMEDLQNENTKAGQLSDKP